MAEQLRQSAANLHRRDAIVVEAQQQSPEIRQVAAIIVGDVGLMALRKAIEEHRPIACADGRAAGAP
jgi:1-deoxy-D-xylulose 5-phosphate reductoisomerase